MRRNVHANSKESKHKKSALESLIPATSTRGRKRPRPGESNSKDDANALKMLNAFKARLEATNLNGTTDSKTQSNGQKKHGSAQTKVEPPPEDDEEAALCDLHFIANCQSCSRWDESGENADEDADDGEPWTSHTLSFAKDRLGKDLTWKKKNEEELVVIDPRERERDIKLERRKERDKGKGKDRSW